MILTPATARAFWRSLMDNAADLITDAQLLLKNGSFGRARSLTVLAQEELGKALWLYESFNQAWNDGDESPRTVERLSKDGRKHAIKYMEAFVFGQELSAFWGEYADYFDDAPVDGTQEDWNNWFTALNAEAEAAGVEANEQKMHGFYVDLHDGDQISSPADIESGTIADDLQTAAQVVEMLLIKDHTRMKHDARTPYDSTHTQQHKLLSIGHPEEWKTASESFRRGDYIQESSEPDKRDTDA